MVDVDDPVVKQTAEECFEQLKNYVKHPFRFFYSNGDGNDGFGATWCAHLILNDNDTPLHAKYYLVDNDVGNGNTQYTVASFIKHYAVLQLSANEWFETPLNFKEVSAVDNDYTPGEASSNVREVREELVLGISTLVHLTINLP